MASTIHQSLNHGAGGGYTPNAGVDFNAIPNPGAGYPSMNPKFSGVPSGFSPSPNLGQAPSQQALMAAAAQVNPALSFRGSNPQAGLTLVHFSAQPDPFRVTEALELHGVSHGKCFH